MISEPGSEREARWWQEWRDTDYSWQGLAGKQWRGWSVLTNGDCVETDSLNGREAQPATLQDYWRACVDENELVTGDGKRWTLAHVPMRWADGTKAKEGWDSAQWEKLGELVAKLASKSKPTTHGGQGNERKVVGADRRAQLSGCILRGIPPQCEPLHVDCERAYFVALDLKNRKFGSDAEFGSAFFRGAAWFSGAKFEDEARFGAAEFASDARFERASFVKEAWYANVVFGSHAWFQGTKFSEDARFGFSEFFGVAGFEGAEFCRSAYFRRVRFASRAWFSEQKEANCGAKFKGCADFSDAAFEDAVCFRMTAFEGPTNLRRIDFLQRADFSNVSPPEAQKNWQCALDGAVFHSMLDWRGVPYRAISALSGAVLQRSVSLSSFSEEDERGAQEHAAEVLAGDDHALRALEGGALVFKGAMAKLSDRVREQRFYRLELAARRRQSGVSALEKWASTIYEFSADYGASIGRPLIGLTVIFLFFALTYWAWEATLASSLAKQVAALAHASPNPQSWAPLWDAFSFSAGRMLPFGPWADDPSWLALMDEHGPGWGFGARIVATLQSLLAIVLAFLFTLAVRRRFQIS